MQQQQHQQQHSQQITACCCYICAYCALVLVGRIMTRRRLNITVVVVVVVVVVTLVTLCCCRCCCCSCCFRFWLHSLLVFSRFFVVLCGQFTKCTFFTPFTHTHAFSHSYTEGARALPTFRPFLLLLCLLSFIFFLLFCTHTFSHPFELSWSGLVVFVVAVGSIYFF